VPEHSPQTSAHQLSPIAVTPCHPSAVNVRTLSLSQVTNLTTLQNYYISAYAAVRASSAGCYIMVAPRTFEQDSGQNDSATPSSWQTFMSADSGYSNVVLDLHKCAKRSSWPGLPSLNPGTQQTTIALTCTRRSADLRELIGACCHKCWQS